MDNNEQHRSGHVVIGVDTHKHVHVAAVMDTIGGILATLTIPTDTGGFQQLLDWAGSYGRILAFGIEGPGSYGATLASFLRRAGHKVVEAGRPDRRLRRMNGKSDTLDAENAARAVLAGFATATPKSVDGEAEMIRQLKIDHDQAVEQLNAAIYRTVIVRMRFHQPTIDYVTRRTAEGKTKRETIRCLKRYVIREVYHLIRPAPRTVPTTS
ncbi:transposase [Streptomyces sp. TE3672]